MKTIYIPEGMPSCSVQKVLQAMLYLFPVNCDLKSTVNVAGAVVMEPFKIPVTTKHIIHV